MHVCKSGFFGGVQKQLDTWVKLGSFCLAFKMLMSYARKPTLKANSCLFSSPTLLSLVAHWPTNVSLAWLWVTLSWIKIVKHFLHQSELWTVWWGRFSWKGCRCWYLWVGIGGKFYFCFLLLCLPHDWWDHTCCSLEQWWPVEGLRVGAQSFVQIP